MDANLSAVEREVLRWSGARAEAGRFGATSFRYGKREIGHLHRDNTADLPVTTGMREDILEADRARPHRAGVKGYVSYPVESAEDVDAVLEILRANHHRARTAAEGTAHSRAEGHSGAKGGGDA